MTTRNHDTNTFSVYDDKIYQTEYYHSLAYCYKDAKNLIPMKQVRRMYHAIKQILHEEVKQAVSDSAEETRWYE